MAMLCTKSDPYALVWGGLLGHPMTAEQLTQRQVEAAQRLVDDAPELPEVMMNTR